MSLQVEIFKTDLKIFEFFKILDDVLETFFIDEKSTRQANCILTTWPRPKTKIRCVMVLESLKHDDFKINRTQTLTQPLPNPPETPNLET